ncbi:hypothetical protein KI387_021157, partial [Taxus chinensis]
ISQWLPKDIEIENIQKWTMGHILGLDMTSEVGNGRKISNPLKELENLVRKSRGVKNLVELVHFMT